MKEKNSMQDILFKISPIKYLNDIQKGLLHMRTLDFIARQRMGEEVMKKKECSQKKQME